MQCTQRRETVWTFLLPPPPLLKGKEAPFVGIPFETGEVGNKRAKSSRRGFCHRRMGNSLNGPRTLSRALVHKFQKMAILGVRGAFVKVPCIRSASLHSYTLCKDPRFDHLPRGEFVLSAFVARTNFSGRLLRTCIPISCGRRRTACTRLTDRSDAVAAPAVQSTIIAILYAAVGQVPREFLTYVTSLEFGCTHLLILIFITWCNNNNICNMIILM